LDELLPDYFVRSHRSHIVNLLKVDCLYNDELVLCENVKLPISRKNSKIVKDSFMRLKLGE